MIEQSEQALIVEMVNETNHLLHSATSSTITRLEVYCVPEDARNEAKQSTVRFSWQFLWKLKPLVAAESIRSAIIDTNKHEISYWLDTFMPETIE